SSTASSAATHTRPGDRVSSSLLSGPTASGNSATTMPKNTSGLSSSAGRRHSRRASRTSSWVNTLLIGDASCAGEVQLAVAGRLAGQAVVGGQQHHAALLAVAGQMRLELGHGVLVEGGE